MKTKLLVYFHTLRYLKPRQIVFQTWYRIKKRLPFRPAYSFYDRCSIDRLRFRSSELLRTEGKYLGNNCFSFINIEHRFDGPINWNLSSNGKLWNYNLQYFDFFFDPANSEEEYIRIIEDCCRCINERLLPLEPYPVCLRVVNWLLFHSATGYSSESFFRCLKHQIAYLEKNQEYHLLANHLLENKITLVIAGLFLRDSGLLDRHIGGLTAQLEEQILPDGGHYECSTMYHSIVLSRLLVLRDLLVSNDIRTAANPQIERTVSKMLGWLGAVCFRNGYCPLLNDSAPDIALPPGILRAAAAAVGARVQQVELKESGYRKLQNEMFELLADIGNITPSYQPGHAHSDMLSFCLSIEGNPVFIDPGVSTYETNKQRQTERSTFFHNTVAVNDENQSDVWGSFRVAKRANIRLLTDEPLCIEAAHDGYLQKYGVLHQRRYDLTPNKLHIKDSLIGDKKKPAKNTAYFYLHPAVNIVQTKPGSFFINGNILLNFTAYAKILVEKVNIPDGFNKFVPTQRLRIEFMTELITQMEIV